MNAHDQQPVRDVSSEARDWFVRLLNEDVTVEEIAAWQAWAAESPENRAAFEKVNETWNLGGEISVPRCGVRELARDEYDGSVPVADWRVSHERSRARRRSLRSAALAAVVILAVSAGGLFMLNSGPGAIPSEAMTTARAEHKSAALPDGSELQLGAMTTVRVRVDEHRRAVVLDRGEVFFAVAHDKTRPFVVETPLATVTAVGTSFNVDVGKDSFTVVVTEGAVVVDPRGMGAFPWLSAWLREPVRVNAGQRLDFDPSGAKPAAQISGALPRIPWMDERLEYRDEPLSRVIEDVNRYSSRPIHINDDALASMGYTGTVHLNAIDEWVAGLPAAFPLRVVEHDDTVLLASR